MVTYYDFIAVPPEEGFDKTSLISWWDLEEESGVRIDAHGDNDLTDNNTVGFAAGKVGNAGSFVQANTEYLSIADNPSLSMGDIDFTVAMWVYFTASALEFFFGKSRSDAATNQTEYGFYCVPDDSPMHFCVGDGPVDGPVGGHFIDLSNTNFGNVASGQWYFLVGWHDSVNDIVGCEINGVSTTASYTYGSCDIIWGLGLGAFGEYLGGTHNGYLDSVLVAKRVYSAEERTWLYNAGAGRQYSDL